MEVQELECRDNYKIPCTNCIHGYWGFSDQVTKFQFVTNQRENLTFQLDLNQVRRLYNKDKFLSIYIDRNFYLVLKENTLYLVNFEFNESKLEILEEYTFENYNQIPDLIKKINENGKYLLPDLSFFFTNK
ncbi:hypothetical protein V6O07_00465 [Arthrospira platensis SPKY2]